MRARSPTPSFVRGRPRLTAPNPTRGIDEHGVEEGIGGFLAVVGESPGLSVGTREHEARLAARTRQGIRRLDERLQHAAGWCGYGRVRYRAGSVRVGLSSSAANASNSAARSRSFKASSGCSPSCTCSSRRRAGSSTEPRRARPTAFPAAWKRRGRRSLPYKYSALRCIHETIRWREWFETRECSPSVAEPRKFCARWSLRVCWDGACHSRDGYGSP